MRVFLVKSVEFNLVTETNMMRLPFEHILKICQPIFDQHWDEFGSSLQCILGMTVNFRYRNTLIW